VTKKIEDAIDLALAVLEEHRNRVEDQNYDPYSSAFFHEELSVCSDVRGPALERENHDLVQSPDGELVPTMSGSCPGINWYSIYDDDKGEHVIARAIGGDYLARNLLMKVASAFVESGCTMPKRLREYVSNYLMEQVEDTKPLRRGQDPHSYYGRNYAIASAVYEVVTQDGFLPTRNRSSEHESACSIVAQALDRMNVPLGERSVEAIWGKFARFFADEG
jgi:hypothetical protein